MVIGIDNLKKFKKSFSNIIIGSEKIRNCHIIGTESGKFIAEKNAL
jgi:hypothetical protein